MKRSGRVWLDTDPARDPAFQEPYPYEARGRSRPRSGAKVADREFLLGEMTWPEAEARLKTVDVALLPVGAVEQHGPHLTLDTTHLGTWGLDLLAFYEQIKKRVVHVHLSDFDGREHRLPGSGQLPLAALLQRLVRDGYGGAISVELHPDALQAENEDQVRAHLHEVLAFCRENTIPN